MAGTSHQLDSLKTGWLEPLYRLLDLPHVHAAIQKMFTFGGLQASDAIRERVQPQKEDRLLDVGCGPARYAKLFPCVYIGLDFNAAFLSHVRKNEPSAKARKVFSLVRGKSARLSFKNESFDYVVCVNILHHMPEQDALATLHEMKRVLKKDGRVLVVENIYPVKRSNFLGRAIFALDRGHHTRTSEELSRLLSAAGYRESSYQQPAAQTFPHERRVYEFERGEPHEG